MLPESSTETTATNLRDRAWYAIWTHSHCERLVAEQLLAKGFEPFLPEVGAWSKRRGQSHLLNAPLFPGYVFLSHAMERHSYIEILKARGIVRILDGGWSRLTAIAPDEIEAIQRFLQSGLPLMRQPYLRQGDRVRVTDGPLAGVEGVFLRDKPSKGRLVVSVNLLQTSVAVEIDTAFIDALTTTGRPS